MTDGPEFLPSRAETNGDWTVVCDSLYAVYQADFCRSPVEHFGTRVFRDRRILPDGQGKEESFWHLITCDDKTVGERLFDPGRASRLPWARPLIVAEAREEVVVFDYEEGNRRLRRYVWLKDDDYVVVLEHKGDRLFLVTAYFIDYEGKRRQLERRAKNAQK